MRAPETQSVGEAITAELWKKVEAALSFSWGRVDLQCDDFRLTLTVVQIKQLRYAIRIFVNGVFLGRWMTEDCEERRRFLRPRKLAIYSHADKVKMKAALKGCGRSYIKTHMDSMNKSITLYDPIWPAFSSLKRHLIANNKVIALLPESDL